MDISTLAALPVPPTPIKPPEVAAPKPPEKKVDASSDTRDALPTPLSPLPPGQGTRVDQLA